MSREWSLFSCAACYILRLEACAFDFASPADCTRGVVMTAGGLSRTTTLAILKNWISKVAKGKGFDYLVLRPQPAESHCDRLR
jgi:hypothetical protein